MKLSVVIPVYNERRTIEEILRRVQSVDLEKEIVLVDDASSDGTREFLMELAAEAQERPTAPILQGCYDLPTQNLKLCFMPENGGKGAAIRHGFKQATGDVVVVQDADLEYDPAEYVQLLAPIEQGKADVVFGSRFLSGPHRVLFFWHYVGNKLLTLLSNMTTNLNLTDMETCYKMFRREVLQAVTLEEDRFGFEPEVTAKIARGGFRVYEIPISYNGRTYAEGKKINWKDGFRALWCIFKYGMLRR
ncbi:MAG: glycosyltransferase family 2 protein [Gemmatimonadetes bacterium]|nr:glycosyltransferase family 2 protein [Gemmatimonadota bacterium]